MLGLQHRGRGRRRNDDSAHDPGDLDHLPRPAFRLDGDETGDLGARGHVSEDDTRALQRVERRVRVNLDARYHGTTSGDLPYQNNDISTMLSVSYRLD